MNNDTYYLLTVSRAEDVPGLPQKDTPNLYVKARLTDGSKNAIPRRTSAKPAQDAGATWKESLPFISSAKAEALTIEIEVYAKTKILSDTHLASCNYRILDLLRASSDSPDDDAVPFVLSPSKKMQLASKIYLRLKKADETEWVESSIKGANLDAEQISGLASAAESTVYRVLQILSKLDEVVKALSAVAEVTPFTNVAWQAVLVIYKVVSNQFEKAEKIKDLAITMEDTFNILCDTKELPNKLKMLEKTIIRLMIQTKKCCDFIQEYIERPPIVRVIKIGSNTELDGFKAAFVKLRKDLNLNLNLQGVVFSAEILEKLDEITETNRRKELRDCLEPEKHEMFDRLPCFDGTRTDVRDKLREFSTQSGMPNILWLNGPPGSGKSTIASTIVKELGGTSIDVVYLSFVRAKHQPCAFVRTIAFKLAMIHPVIRSCIYNTITSKSSDIIISGLASTQFEKLLLEPLEAAKNSIQGSILIILDAFDECGSPDARRNMMAELLKTLPMLPSCFRFLITSRPEPDIMKAFSSQPGHFTELNLDNFKPDIFSYICTEMHNWNIFGKVLKNENDIRILGDAAGDSFIWASTAVKLIYSSGNQVQALTELVRTCCPSKKPSLYHLYSTILRDCGIQWNTEGEHFSSVIGLILSSKVFLTSTKIDGILGLPKEQSSKIVLSKIKCLLEYSDIGSIRLFHVTLSDYLRSYECRIHNPMPESGHGETTGQRRPSGCDHCPWLIDITTQNAKIASQCFSVMKMLFFNMCDIKTSYKPNGNDPTLHTRIKKRIPFSLDYACTFWAHHLSGARKSDEPESPLLCELRDFLNNRLLYWFEALSLLEKVNVGGPALLAVIRWTASNDTEVRSFLRDARRLINTFAFPIKQSAPHVYLSMLPLTADESKVSAHYLKKARLLVRVHRRGAKQSSPLLNVLTHGGLLYSVTFSPDGTVIASVSSDETVKLWDVESGEVADVLHPGVGIANSISFSPDGT